MAMNIEPWRACVSWLVRCEVLRPDHQSCQQRACIEDFAYTIRDGVLLCNLINTLEPDCLDTQYINVYPQTTRCLCIQNINTFLKACHEVFGMKENDLFLPLMLFEFTNIHLVLLTLSKLSTTSKATLRTRGFHIQRSPNDEDVSKFLSLSEIDSRRSIELSGNAAYSTHRESIRQDAIYEKLVSLKPPKLSVSSEEKDKTDFIIEEIIMSEKSYLEGVLRVLLQVFMKPLKNVLTQLDLEAVFGDIEALTILHEELYSDLKESIDPERSASIGEVFLKFHGKFLIYGEYCANLPGAQELLKNICQTQSKVKEVINKCQAEVKDGRFTLRDMLIVPMQHILRYRLLIERLMGETKDTQNDYKNLEKALEVMTDVNCYVNEVKRDKEILKTIQTIQERIVDLQIPGNKKLIDYGRLHKDDEVRIKTMDQKINNRYIFVFDHVMLICKCSRDNTYICQESLSLFNYTIKDIAVQGTVRWNYQWTLVHKKTSKGYVMYARNEDQKQDWIKAILTALDNIEPDGCKDKNHLFVMHTFDKPTMCSSCNKSLKGLIMQGYKCFNCEIAVHKCCIKQAGQCGITNLKIQTELPTPPYSAETKQYDDHFLSQYSWFAGKMSRDEADLLLERQRRGTFMLRVRPNQSLVPEETAYAISVKSSRRTTHLRVYRQVSSGQYQYYLSEARFFSSVPLLVDFYKHWTLQENYDELDEMLRIPFKEVQMNTSFDTLQTQSEENENEDEMDYMDMNKIESRKISKSHGKNECDTRTCFPDFTDQNIDHPHRLEVKIGNVAPDSTDPLPFTRSCSTGTLNISRKSRNRSQSENSFEHLPQEASARTQYNFERHKCKKADAFTQTTNLNSECTPEEIQKFGEFVITGLKLLKDKNILLDTRRYILKVIHNALEKDSVSDNKD